MVEIIEISCHSESRMVVARACGELVFTGYRISFGEDEEFLEMDTSNSCTTV